MDNTHHHIANKHHFTSFTKSIRSRMTSSGGFPSRTTYVNSRMSSSSFSGFPSRTTLLHHIANNLPLWTWWQPRWCLVTTTDRYIKNTVTPCHSLHFWHHSNTMSLSPFDIKGKGQIKTNILSPFSPHAEEAFCRSEIYWSDQAPLEFMLNLQTYFSMKYKTLWLSYHQWLILTSNIHPSDFTYETQVPNQVGLHIST